MVELIAVLIIIGILAAVATPKFMDLTTAARDRAAVGGISEAKSVLSTTFAKVMLTNGGTQPTLAQLYAAWPGGAIASGDVVTFGDVKVSLTTSGANIAIATVSVSDGKAPPTFIAVGTPITQTWELPTVY